MSDSFPPHELWLTWLFPARILVWFAISSPKESSRPRDCVSYGSYIGRQILFHLSHLGSPFNQFISVQMCFNHQHSFVMPQSPPMYLLFIVANLLDFDIAHCHIPINNTDFSLSSSGILNGMIYERHFRRVKRNICVEIRTQVIIIVPLLYPIENYSSTKRTDSVLRKLFTHSFIHSFHDELNTI